MTYYRILHLIAVLYSFNKSTRAVDLHYGHLVALFTLDSLL